MNNENIKILIVINNLAIGGVQRSLINLLSQIKDKYHISLFIFSNSGEYKDFVPSEVTVIEASPFLRILGRSQADTKQMGYLFYYIRALLAFWARIFTNNLPIQLLISTHRKLYGYDIAISFSHNAEKNLLYGGCNEFVLQRVEAEEKIAFIHCDFANYGGSIFQSRKIYSQFDRIAAVSEGCRHSFIKVLPELKQKIFCVNNCHDYKEYISKGRDNPVVYPGDRLNIVTVARLSPEKGILRGINIIARLVREGHHIRWHIVGDGVERKKIGQLILENNASDYILLYGKQENPFRYITNADLFFLPSFHEAAPMVINEAKALGVPIITTSTTSVKEMVIEGKEGIVCENSEDGIYQAFKTIIDNPQIIFACREYLRNQHYTNEKALLQFNRLIAGRN